MPLPALERLYPLYPWDDARYALRKAEHGRRRAAVEALFRARGAAAYGARGLAAAGYVTADDIRACPDRVLLGFPNFRRASVARLRVAFPYALPEWVEEE